MKGPVKLGGRGVYRVPALIIKRPALVRLRWCVLAVLGTIGVVLLFWH